MNGDDQLLPDFGQHAAELDPLANVPTELLLDIVEERGTCWWEVMHGDPPDIAAPMPDRALAARMCAGCPVQRECLELELRTEGSATAGVWGALCEVDRRALHTAWQRRRARVQRVQDTGRDDMEGGARR